MNDFKINLDMEIVIRADESADPTTLQEVLQVLKKMYLTPRLDSRSWGEWIHLEGFRTVISIESRNGLTSSATIEVGDGEEEGEPLKSITAAFAKLGWHGINSDGIFELI